MSREFSGVWVEFGFMGDFVFPNGSLLWGCHFHSSLALNQQCSWKWPRTSKDFAFYNPHGGIIDRYHHTWLSLIIYVFFCNKKFRIHFLTPHQGVKFVFVFTCSLFWRPWGFGSTVLSKPWSFHRKLQLHRWYFIHCPNFHNK